MRPRHFCRKKLQAPYTHRKFTNGGKQLLGKFLDASFSHSLGPRTYKVHVPKSYRGQALPLLVMLHGCTQDPDDFAAGTRMNLLSEKSSCFALYPCQPQFANPSKCWNWFNTEDQRRDHGEPAIIAGMTLEVVQAYNIDATQVFIAGMSAGAAMAVIMAAAYPELYAAVGAHSGMAYRSAQNILSAMHAMRNGAASPPPLGVAGIPVIAFHGDRDRTVNPRNSERIISQWLESHPEASSPDCGEITGKSNGRAYVRTQYRDSRGVLAEYWLVKNSGHAWSGGSASGSYADPNGPDASAEMLRFFLRGRRRSGLLSRLIRAIKPAPA
jgi:poly(hydroxyalkanoate) depolymerase family esterase